MKHAKLVLKEAEIHMNKEHSRPRIEDINHPKHLRKLILL